MIGVVRTDMVHIAPKDEKGMELLIYLLEQALLAEASMFSNDLLDSLDL